MLGSLLLIIATGATQAQAATPVYVAPFEATHAAATGLSTMLPDFLSQQLALRRSTFDVVALEDIGQIYDISASEYAASCPEGEFVGCAYVLGEAGGARYAVTGRVTVFEDNNLVDLRIVDLQTAQEVVSFEVRYSNGEDTHFSEGVVRTLAALVEGRLVVGDLRSYRDAEPVGPDKERSSTELGQLDREIGGVGSLRVRDEGILEEEDYTMEDLVADMASEGTKPWERLDMSPREFLRYKGSGMPLYQWRELAKGRKSKLLVRGMAGFGRVPSMGTYYGRVALSSATLDVVETYAWQTIANGSSLQVGAAVGYGILPTLDVSLGLGLATGQFTVDIHRVTEGDFTSSPTPSTFPSRSLSFGPEVRYVPLPTSTVRPVVGGFANVWLGSVVDNHILPPQELPNGGVIDPLGTPGALVVGALGGLEVGLSDKLDLWMNVPVGAVVASWNAPDTHHEGEGVLESLEAAPEIGVASAGVMLGVQVRALGERKKKPTLEDYE